MKHRILLPLLAVSATALIAAGPAADLNQDGQVTRAEFMAASDARFAQADTDFDGQLTRDEMRALKDAKATERAQKRFAKMDANGDGAVSEAEMLAAREARMERRDERKGDRRARMLQRFDADGDGTLSDDERASAKAERDALRFKRRAANADGERKGKRGKRPKLDTNGDSLISATEYSAGAEALFIRMDANGDGVLTEGEGKRRRKGKRGGAR